MLFLRRVWEHDDGITAGSSVCFRVLDGEQHGFFDAPPPIFSFIATAHAATSLQPLYDTGQRVSTTSCFRRSKLPHMDEALGVHGPESIHADRAATVPRARRDIGRAARWRAMFREYQ
jgi:hypothetical protein